MAKSLVVVVPHELGQAGARRRLETSVEAVKSRFAAQVSSIDTSWTGDHLDVVVRAIGQTVTAGLDVAEDKVTIEVRLPWMLAMIAEKARGVIQKEATLLLEKKTS